MRQLIVGVLVCSARDNGLPFSKWLATVNRTTLTPINSLVLVLVFVVLICLIGLGSET